ncbi:MAG TPA: tetratricopeptide repeat protein [Hyphomicrobiaceae bacterium]
MASAIESSQALQRAMEHARQGRLAEARQLCEGVLATEPANSGALSCLGEVLLAMRRPEEALACFERLVQAQPNGVEALCNRGIALLVLGRHEPALASLDRAMQMAPADAAVLFHRGICLMALQRWQEAVDSLDRVLAGMPQHAPTLAKRGDALVAMRRFEEALASFTRALSAAPGDVGLLNNRARVLMELSRPQEALAVYEQVLQTRPGDADAWYNAGNGLAGSSRFEEALGRYDRALAIAPAHVLALSNRGNALRRLGRLDEALASYDRALAIRPDLVDTLHNRGNVLAALGRTAEARASYERVLDLEPRYLPARWALVMGAIPVAAGSKAEIDEGRRVFAAGLDELAWLAPDGLQGARAVQQMVPFYLAYHEENNRDLFARYGAICAQATEEQRRTQPRGRPVRPRVRLAVVSAHVRSHSVWHALLKGAFQHLDARRIDIEVFHLSAVSDAETDWARTRSRHFEQGPLAPELWAERIRAREPDVVLYPEVGMDPATAYLASQRLGAVQAATWGHPHTTGMPTMDCFFSAAALEPPDGDEHYTERLIRLPRLGCCFAPSGVEAAQVDLATLGIRADRPLLLSPGTPYKYAPEHDWVLAEIAARLGRCTIVLFRDAGAPWSALYPKLLDRISAAFTARGVSFAEHCVVLPWQHKPAFYGLMQRADLMLDTIGFSGFNTAMQAVECGLPIVTREGRFMRGRFAGGILESMRLGELVAADENAYVEMAVRLAGDPSRRREIKGRIEAERGALFDDVGTVRELEEHLLELARR